MKELKIVVFLSLTWLWGQSQNKAIYQPFELSLMTGHHQPLGIFGAKIGYRPNILHRLFQVSGGIGGGRVQSLRLSAGVDFFPLKDGWVTPYLGTDYSFGLGTSLGSEDGTELYHVGIHHYVCPYGAVRIKTWTDQLNFKLQFGYSDLLNNPNIKVLGVQGPDYAYILNKVESHLMIVVGVSSVLGQRNSEPRNTL